MQSLLSVYPESERDAWILARRGPRNSVDPLRPYQFFVEEERTASGQIAQTAAVFLTNRECPWRCVMCDLWRNTLPESTAPGAIPAQIDYALARLPVARQIKLYNSGSFFDPHAIPPEDLEAIAKRVSAFDRVIVECHPALVGDACLGFKKLLRGRLEIAMGLETAQPEILARLNKRMTLKMFHSAAEFLRTNDFDLRVFILVKPPFMNEDEAVVWTERSLLFAFECGASVATLIPTRGGNGAMEALAEAGEYSPPKLRTLEAALERGIAMHRGRVFADLWDVAARTDCTKCRDARIARLRAVNLSQSIPEAIACDACE